MQQNFLIASHSHQNHGFHGQSRPITHHHSNPNNNHHQQHHHHLAAAAAAAVGLNFQHQFG